MPMPARSSASTSPAIRMPSSPRSTWAKWRARASCTIHPAGTLTGLQARTSPYPRALARALRDCFEWEAGFSLANARKSLDRGDVSYLAGCAFRAVACLCQALFALNGVYLPNEKGAVAAADGFARKPADFARRVASLYAAIGSGAHRAGLDQLASLIDETRALTSR